MQIRLRLFFLLVCSPLFMMAQKKFTLSGYVKEAQNGETLTGATVAIEGKSKGISTNQFGFYSLTLVEGTYNITCSYVGFQTVVMKVELTSDKEVNFNLESKNTLAEVIVSTKKRDANIKNAQMGKFT